MVQAKNILDCIGATPLVDLSRRFNPTPARLSAKVEFFNPGGSVKDRVAREMVAAAEREGRLAPGATIVEPTSGNTGVGLALVCAVKGYRLVLTMPETMSVERRKLAAAYGAEIVLTPGAQGMAGAISRAQAICAETPRAVMLQQFENPANPLAHAETTGPEIWKDTAGDIAAFVAGAGTGGTLTGVGRYLKKMDPRIRLVAVEPASSPVLSGGRAAPHGLQGIGAGFVPATLDVSLVDEVIAVTEEQAAQAARRVASAEGLLVGISSGAALWAALELGKRPCFADRRIVVLLPDTGERYLSTWLFGET